MTSEEIEQIHREFMVPGHIIKHMYAVAKVSGFLCDRLIESGLQIRKKETIDAAKLHDTLRVCDIKKFTPETFPEKARPEEIKFWEKLRIRYGEIGHEQAMANILNERNEAYLANLVVKHGFLRVYDLGSWEEKILYYADKRVDKDQVVSLKKRFKEGMKRNFTTEDNAELIEKTELKVFQLEKEFVDILGKCVYSL